MPGPKAPIPEKTEEILFVRYFLQASGLGQVTTYAPSTVDEAKEGYDSRFLGVSRFREIYLQFKAPTCLERGGDFSIKIATSQHLRLKEYEPNAAYYVAHTFSSLQECTEVQRATTTSKDFLKYFVAIEISALPPDVSYFHYYKPASHRISPRIWYRRKSDGEKYEVDSDRWLRGNQLLKEFGDDHVGVLVEPPPAEDGKHSPPDSQGARSGTERLAEIDQKIWRPSPAEVDSLFSGRRDKGDTFGSHIRKILPGVDKSA